MTIISDLISKSSALLHGDGLKVFQSMQDGGSVSFKGIVYASTAFLKASIGKYVQEYGQQNLTVADVNEVIYAKIKMIIK